LPRRNVTDPFQTLLADLPIGSQPADVLTWGVRLAASDVPIPLV
jgi:hypothetical protein